MFQYRRYQRQLWLCHKQLPCLLPISSNALYVCSVCGRTSKGHLFEVRSLVLKLQRTAGTHCKEDAALRDISL
jgi:DNA-directed RNA polymerase subunit RPC12/RpoP